MVSFPPHPPFVRPLLPRPAVCLPLPLSLLLLCWPHPAQAIQTHGPPEGIVVHQLAHAVFLLALVAMVLRIYFSQLALRRSWRFISRAAIILAVWNLWAFTGHQLEMAVPVANLTAGPDREPLLVMDSWITVSCPLSPVPWYRHHRALDIELFA